MARQLLIPNPENATIQELKDVSRVGSTETATRCAALQILLAGADRNLVCEAFVITDRAIRKWINLFNTTTLFSIKSWNLIPRSAILSNNFIFT